MSPWILVGVGAALGLYALSLHVQREVLNMIDVLGDF